MDEANLCERVALFFDGQIQKIDTPDNLKIQYKYSLFQINVREQIPMIRLFKSIPEVHSIQKFGDSLHISFQEEPDQTRWDEFKNNSEGNLISWNQINPSIEDIFLDMMENTNE
jgi:hypothetical protein